MASPSLILDIGAESDDEEPGPMLTIQDAVGRDIMAIMGIDWDQAKELYQLKDEMPGFDCIATEYFLTVMTAE